MATQEASSVQHLRVLIANERQEHLELLAGLVAGLGHEVVSREIAVEEAGAATARDRPDLALVGIGPSSGHALELVSRIVREAFCPVIAVLTVYDGDWVNEAAKRGVYAYIIGGDPDELQSAIEITFRRFADYQSLHGAFERRNAQSVREQKVARLRQRDALELHDGVVQSLTVAHLALQLDQKVVSREAVLTALSQAKSIVARVIEELKESGIPQEQLIRDAAGRGDG
jgi:AmiR/NasT family two-component response regulator